MNTKTRKTTKKYTRDSVHEIELHATKYLEAYLKDHAPAGVYDLWRAHYGLVVYSLGAPMPHPEIEAAVVDEAQDNVATVLRVAGPLPKRDSLLSEILDAWPRMTLGDRAELVNLMGLPVPVATAAGD